MVSDIMKKLRVGKNSRFFETEDNKPFFWIGDTAWELFHKLGREDGKIYLEDRSKKKFTVIQAALLAESDNLENGNFYGKKPFKQQEDGTFLPLVPALESDFGYGYWEHVNFFLELALTLSLYMAILPAWGDKISRAGGQGPEIFNADSAFKYGRWLGERYKKYPNIIWILGGDRLLTERRHFEAIHAMAEGIRRADTEKHLISFHPYGGYSSSYHLGNEDWMDFNMIQSGHRKYNIENYMQIQKDYGRQPYKPVLDGEPCYEDHPVGFSPADGYFDDSDIRKAAYWAVFAGACGHTYGHHSIWSMNTACTDYFLMDWKRALNRPGAGQMQFLRELMESRDFSSFRPDDTIIADNYKGAGRQLALRGNREIMLYIPSGLPVRGLLMKIPFKNFSAQWFNPRNGKYSKAERCPAEDKYDFLPSSSGRNQDWVLIIENTAM